MSELEDLNQKYRRQIRPIMEMLKHKQIELNRADWENLVRKTEQNIVNAPDQYLSDLPKKGILDLIIHRLFNEFLNESI
jgi:hypothetical protein